MNIVNAALPQIYYLLLPAISLRNKRIDIDFIEDKIAYKMKQCSTGSSR